MIELKFINSRDEEMNALYNDYMTITAIDALHGVDNEFSSSTSPYFDGDIVDHIRTNPRTITLTYALKTGTIRTTEGIKRISIEDSLNYFNSIVKSKQKATLIETTSTGDKITIEGIVTVPPYTRVSEQVAVQIQLYCSDPYWEDVVTIVTDISDTIDKHCYPYESEESLLANEGGLCFTSTLDDDGNLVVDGSYTDIRNGNTYSGLVFGEENTDLTKVISNEGDVPVGMVIEIVALGTVINPRLTRDSFNWIGVGDEDKEVVLLDGDYIRISTVRGDKYIKSNRVDIDNNISLIRYTGNDWLQLETGDNELYSGADEGSQNIYFSVFHKRKWQ